MITQTAAAAGVHRALPGRRAPRLLGLYGAGLMAAGVFRAAVTASLHLARRPLRPPVPARRLISRW